MISSPLGVSDSAGFDDWLTASRSTIGVGDSQPIALADLARTAAGLSGRAGGADRALLSIPCRKTCSDRRCRHYRRRSHRRDRRYESCATADEEMGVPTAETRALYDETLGSVNQESRSGSGSGIRIDGGPTRAPAASRNQPSEPQSAPAFTGREVELTKLTKPLHLASWRLSRASPASAKRVWRKNSCRLKAACPLGVAHELEHALPYQPFIEALRGLFASPGWSSPSAVEPARMVARTARLVPEAIPRPYRRLPMNHVCGRRAI
jgi:hypothetical protein